MFFPLLLGLRMRLLDFLLFRICLGKFFLFLLGLRMRLSGRLSGGAGGALAAAVASHAVFRREVIQRADAARARREPIGILADRRRVRGAHAATTLRADASSPAAEAVGDERDAGTGLLVARPLRHVVIAVELLVHQRTRAELVSEVGAVVAFARRGERHVSAREDDGTDDGSHRDRREERTDDVRAGEERLANRALGRVEVGVGRGGGVRPRREQGRLLAAHVSLLSHG